MMAASWECPSLPMLSLPFKETGKTSFLGLKPMIGAHYEENPDTFSEEIKQLDQLRELSTKPKRDYNGCSVLRRYFAQLHLLRARFPPETVGQIPVDFSWRDVFSGVEYIQEGFQIEQASVLYNIAALHSQLGSHGKRDSEQEMKEAVTHFQCSAGALSYLDEHFAINHASKDLTAEFVSFYNSLMLGQAQECLVEKSLKGIGRVKNLTIARLATRVGDYYSRCSSLLEGGNCAVIAKKNKDWPKLLKFKVLYYQSIAHYYQGVNAEEMGKYGELIALLQLTVQKLNSITGKPPKGMGDQMKQARQNFADHVTDKLSVSKRQNDQIYHDNVPPLDTLELVTGADLVKPVSFHPTDTKNLGADIFSRLIPMRAHEVASIFSEEKAKLMRSIMSSVEEKDEELQQYMRSLNVTEVEKVHEEMPTIPDNVMRLHKAMQGRAEDVRKLHSSCQELMAMSKSAEEDFAAIRETKKKEEEEEEKFQTECGLRPASKVVEGLWADLNQYHGYHVKAVKSNTELKAMFDQSYPNLVLLTSPLGSLQAAIPKMTLLDAPTEETSESERWDKLLKKVEEMTQQRQTLVAKFRQLMNNDDITRNLVGHLGSDQEVFLEEQMKQFKEVSAIIRQNLSAQDNILIALTEANAKKASTRLSVQEITQQQQTMYTGLVKSGGYLNLLKKKLQEGIDFYVKLHSSVSQLRTKSGEICQSRSRERLILLRQKEAAVQPDAISQSTETDSAPQPTLPAPDRPPKKAELSGNPLPSQPHPNLPPGVGSPSHVPGYTPIDAHQTQQLDIAKLKQVQMEQQQALIGGQASLPMSEAPKLENQQLQPLQSGTNGMGASDGGFIPPSLHAVSVPSTPVTAATDALNNLNTLLETNPDLTQPLPPLQPSSEGSAGVIDPTLLPQRPPKPAHLKAEPLPSPFPSFPPALSSEGQNTLLPAGSSSTGDHHQPDNTTSQSGLYQDPTQSSGLYNTLLHDTSLGQQQPQHSGSNVVPHSTTLPTVLPTTSPPPPSTATVESSISPPPLSNPGIGHNPLPSTVPLSLPITPPPPQYQPNINIQAGEVTVATSSILAPIPSALPVPYSSSSTSLPTSPSPHPPTSSLSPPPQEPVTGASSPPIGNVSIQPTPLLQEDTVVPSMSPSILKESTPDTQSVVTLHTTMPHTSGTVVDSHSPAINTNTTVSVTGITGTPTHSLSLRGDKEQREIPDSVIPEGSVSGTGDRVSHVISHDVSGVQTVTLPETEPQTQPHVAAPVSCGGLSVSTNVPLEPNDLSNVVSTGVTGIGNSHPNLTTSPVPSSSANISLSSYIPTNPMLPHGAIVSPQSFTDPSITTTTTVSPITTISLPVSPVHSVPPSSSLASPSLALSSISGVVPLPLANIGPLSTPLHLEGASMATELMLDTLPQQQAIQQLKKEIEVLKTEREAQTKQEVSYRQQVAQLQQEIHTSQLKREQEKAAAFDQHSSLTKLLEQQQKLFSQQQNQIEKLSQQDESHRKEYLHVEEKLRETLRTEQEIKLSLQGQILQLTQENQKLNQTIQTQSQQVQTLQLQLQQYSIHIQERDKQLIALRDQHNEIVGKLVKQSQQKIQELQIQLSQRPQERPQQMLPQPLKPTVVQHQKPNPQQNQDLGPTNIQHPNLPQPLQPNVLTPSHQPPSIPQPVSSTGGAVQPPPQHQGVGGHRTNESVSDQRMMQQVRHPHPQQFQPSPANSQPLSQPSRSSPMNQTPPSMPAQRQHPQMQQMHGQPQIRPPPQSLPPLPTGSPGVPQPPSGILSPSTPQNFGPAIRQVSHPPALQSQGSYPSHIAQHPQRPQSHIHQPVPNSVFPSQPLVQQVPSTSQPMMVPQHGAPGGQQVLSPQPRSQQPQDIGTRFPHNQQMMQQPMALNQPYGHNIQQAPQVAQAQYRPRAP